MAADGKSTEIVVDVDNHDAEIVHVKNKGKTTNFELDKVFSPVSTQEDVFEACKDIITSSIDGYNVCIFAYGQTGSGKTFTMDGPDANPGLNRRALRELFRVRMLGREALLLVWLRRPGCILLARSHARAA